MKISTQIKTSAFALLVSMLTFTSCDEVEELTKVDVDTTLTESISVSIEQGDDAVQTFAKSMSIGIDNQEINDNRDKIEGLVITAMSYAFKNVNGNEEALVSGTLTIGNKSFSIEQTNPLEDQVNNLVKQVEDPSFLNDVAILLKNNETIDMTLSGEAENAPVDFTMEVKINVTATVNGL